MIPTLTGAFAALSSVPVPRVMLAAAVATAIAATPAAAMATRPIRFHPRFICSSRGRTKLRGDSGIGNYASRPGLSISRGMSAVAEQILSREALDFISLLHRELNPRRLELLAARPERHAAPPTEVLEVGGDWRVAEAPADLLDRRVEITGPVDRKMMINALNSGAQVFMADFEDACSPTWENVLQGQQNVRDAVRRELLLETLEKRYSLNDELATLVIRPRGWQLVERHVGVDGEPVSASLFDFGLTFFHNAREQLERGTGPYFYLPKLESHLEARLWNDA